MSRRSRPRPSSDPDSPPPLPSIAAEWASLCRLVLPDDAPLRQMSDVRDAFYAGFSACMAIVETLGDGSPASEAQGLAVLTSLQAEIRVFAADIQRRSKARVEG
jgi:hypothetical protein